MNARLVPTPWRRTPRAWARLALAVAATAGGGALAAALLVADEEAGRASERARARAVASGPRPVAPPSGPAPAPGPPPAGAPARPRPARLADVARQDVTLSSGELAGWTRDAGLDPQTRYAALRRLEALDPAAAVDAAIAATTDASPLVRHNALALLARSQDPRAAEAVALLDDRSRRVAAALARR